MTTLSEKQQVLIVDADPSSAQKLNSLLCADYSLTIAYSSEDALRIATAEPPPDIIMLSVQGPDSGGYGLCRKLKDNNRLSNVPVIFIANCEAQIDEVQSFEAGAVDYLTLPFHPLLIQARIKTHLELKRQRDLLENLSTLDCLTGIANRRQFDEHLKVAAAYASRNSFPLSLIMIDIDLFRAYNEFYGRFQGDICMIKVARAISANFKRLNDLAARFDGDKFACILPSARHHDTITIAEQIRRDVLSLKIPHEASAVDQFVTVSLGVSTILAFDNSSVSSRLITAADSALDSARALGANRVA